MHIKSRIFKKKSSKHENGNSYNNISNHSKYQSFDRPADSSEVEIYIQSPQNRRKRSSSQRRNIYGAQNEIKERLFSTNPVYNHVKSSLNTMPYRTILPQKFTPEERFPLLSVITNAGPDLTRFTFPVTFN